MGFTLSAVFVICSEILKGIQFTEYLTVSFLSFSFTGESCEVNSRSGRCAPGVCKNGGTCVNLLIGGFMCECPPGEYEKPYCEMTTRSFPPQSFVTFKGLRQRFHFTVSLKYDLLSKAT